VSALEVDGMKKKITRRELKKNRDGMSKQKAPGVCLYEDANGLAII